MSADTLPAMRSGWTYSQAGTPCAYVMPVDRPGEASVTAFDTWWQALHYAVMYAQIYPRCRYVGGPGQ